MFTQFMNLGMAVVTGGDTVWRARGLDLIVFEQPVSETRVFITGLQEAAAAAAAIIIRPVRKHLNQIFFADHRLDNKAQVIGDGITKRFAHDLARVLNRELNLQIFVPFRIDLKLPFPDPFGIIFVDVLYFEIMRQVEFLQSCQD